MALLSQHGSCEGRPFGAPPTRPTAASKGRLRPALALAIALLVGLPSAAAAAPQGVTEVSLKSAFVYKFTLFAEWRPDALGDADAPISICVLGHSDLADALDDAVRDRTAQNRPIEVRRLTETSNVDGCQVAFIGWTDAARVDRALKRLSKRPILTVGEVKGFAERGGMINLAKQGNRFRLEINLQAVHAAGLRLSSQLLRIAKLVEAEGAE